MPDHSERPSGEINTLILQRVTEVASKVESVATGQAELKLSMQLSFQEGKHRMDGLAQRIETLEKEKNGCQKGQSDEDSDWSKPAKHKHRAVDQREVQTDRTAKPAFKLDMPTLIKVGMLIGAVLAGYAAAGKVGP